MKIGDVTFSNDTAFVFIGGPCVIEGYSEAFEVAKTANEICKCLNIPYVFKSSFDKANRTSLKSKRGVGIAQGLSILSRIRQELSIPTLTDVHLPSQCDEVASVVDILQIPAFLCRQTDLLEAAAKTGKAIHVKKGQFLAPQDMINIVKKLEHFGATQILLCDRGTSFGYHTLVSDFRGLPIMSQTRYPVIFDATHSIQLPSANECNSGGERQFAPILARAAVAVGVAGIFMEVHKDPDKAPCDGPNMIHLKDLAKVLTEIKAIDEISKKHPRRL